MGLKMEFSLKIRVVLFVLYLVLISLEVVYSPQA